MAEHKKSIILYVDVISTFEALSDEEAGRLIKHLLRYVNDKNPEYPDKLTQIAFEPIKQQLKRDLVKWEHKLNQWHLAGVASAEKRRSTQGNAKQRTLTDVESRSTVSTVTVNVNDTVNDIFNIKIGQQLFKIKPSEIVKLNQQRYETLLMTALPGINQTQLLESFDKEYSATDFNDINHFFNALKKTGKGMMAKNNTRDIKIISYR